MLLFRIYTEDKPSANYVQKWWKIISKNYQNYIHLFHYKRNVFAEHLKVAFESSRYTEHGLNNIGLEYAVQTTPLASIFQTFTSYFSKL